MAKWISKVLSISFCLGVNPAYAQANQPVSFFESLLDKKMFSEPQIIKSKIDKVCVKDKKLNEDLFSDNGGPFEGAISYTCPVDSGVQKIGLNSYKKGQSLDMKIILPFQSFDTARAYISKVFGKKFDKTEVGYTLTIPSSKNNDERAIYIGKNGSEKTTSISFREGESYPG